MHPSPLLRLLTVLLTSYLFFFFAAPAEAGNGAGTEVKIPFGPLAQIQPEAADTPSETDQPEGKTRRDVKKDTEDILVQEGGVLIPKGTLIVEPSFNYIHSSNNQINVQGFSIFQAILIGKFQVEKIKRDILVGGLTLRYGIMNGLQLDLRVPYVYRRERLVIPASLASEEGQQQVTDIDDHGLGDIEGSLSYHAFRARRWLPDITLNLKGKSTTGRDPFGLDTEEVERREIPKELPTGTGFYGLSGGFTLVKVHDPVVFFGSFSYFWNIKRDVGGDFGEIDPGDSYEYSLGMATALSEKVSLSFSFQNTFTDSTKIEGTKLPDSELNSANLLIGINYRLSSRVSLFGSVGIGLTEDSSDYQLQFNVPITFKIF